MKVHTCDPVLQKEEQFKIKFSYIEVEVSLSCMRPCLKNTRGWGEKKMNKYLTPFRRAA